MAGHWYSVTFNGETIGTVGSQADDRSNIWTAAHVFDIDTKRIRPVNTLTITVFGTYEIGLSSFPVLLTDHTESRRIMNWLRVVITGIPIFSAAFLIFGFLLLLFLYLQSSSKEPAYILYGLSALFMSFTGIDYVEIYDTIVPAIVFHRWFVFLRKDGSFPIR